MIPSRPYRTLSNLALFELIAELERLVYNGRGSYEHLRLDLHAARDEQRRRERYPLVMVPAP